MTPLLLNQIEVLLHHHGAMWLASKRVLVVADMHLEKGSAYAGTGQLLPPYDSLATLSKLTSLVDSLKPECLVSLGDGFHDMRAAQRMHADVKQGLHKLAERLQLIWISGNHDPQLSNDIPGKSMDRLEISGLHFCHEPHKSAFAGEVAGHFHPVAKVLNAKGRKRARAFVSDGNRLILPAFGTYAGGLNCRDIAISQLFSKGEMAAYVCGSARIYRVDHTMLVD